MNRGPVRLSFRILKSVFNDLLSGSVQLPKGVFNLVNSKQVLGILFVSFLILGQATAASASVWETTKDILKGLGGLLCGAFGCAPAAPPGAGGMPPNCNWVCQAITDPAEHDACMETCNSPPRPVPPTPVPVPPQQFTPQDWEAVCADLICGYITSPYESDWTECMEDCMAEYALP